MADCILIVDDEDWVLQTLRGYLEAAGFAVVTAADGPGAVAQFEAAGPQLVILDWMLPGFDGMEVASRIRARSDVPIIMLTARTEEGDRITGLESGADDYVVKPFSARELEARVRAVLRRAQDVGKPAILEAGDLRVDLDRRLVSVAHRAVNLTAMEFDLLVFLMGQPGRVYTRLELLEALRGSTYRSFERSIDSHVKRLRQKIEPAPKDPRYIVTVFGIGYRFAKQEGVR